MLINGQFSVVHSDFVTCADMSTSLATCEKDVTSSNGGRGIGMGVTPAVMACHDIEFVTRCGSTPCICEMVEVCASFGLSFG
jgi:hypothetical protein